MDEIPIKFDHKGRHFAGSFGSVFGAGAENVWHLTIHKYYCGRLRFTDKWVFDSTPKFDISYLADFFGEHITGWKQQKKSPM